ncbi:hypothetical protein AAE02nite_36680 [Adhaeribacter aerolatus]|uniref:O-antigen ligase-related domain-containing protein n=1 Tax=Adhaeribacter aerolatus TaxID=670289 RepID=A0A512B212_9BACT|nr:hypothetical protein AAE02nite_36680 [Adhaeribacter aerolatus]
MFFFAKCVIEEINSDPDFGLELLKRLKFLALISIGFLVMQLIIGLGFTFYAALNTNTNTGAESTFRYPSFFHDAQKYAQYLAMSSFLFFIDTDRTKVRSNIYKLTLFLIMVIGLILSGGRAGFLGMCCGLAFLFLTGRNKYKMLGLLGIFIASFLIITFADKIPLLNRSETVDESYEIRNRYWQQALNIYEDNTILGIGIGNYRNYVAAYSPDQFWLLENGEILFFDHPESGYLKFLIEFGLIGFCICMLFFIIPIGSFVIEYIKTKCYTPFFLIASVISFLVSFITVYTLSDYRIAVLLIAVICVLIKSRNVFEDIC